MGLIEKTAIGQENTGGDSHELAGYCKYATQIKLEWSYIKLDGPPKSEY